MKTKDILAFDEGLAENQAHFVMVVRPLLTTLTALDAPDDEGAGPNADTSRIILNTLLSFR